MLYGMSMIRFRAGNSRPESVILSSLYLYNKYGLSRLMNTYHLPESSRTRYSDLVPILIFAPQIPRPELT